MKITRSKIASSIRNLLTAAALAGVLLALPSPPAHASVFVSVGLAPPALPYYAQPLCPGDGYIWTPGYWAYGDNGYYWVDGAWVYPPYEDALWTPGWWGFGGGGYFWNAGYWGRTVGYYGGINYGFGYFGTGFYGGYWNGGHFWYNRAYGHFGAGFHGNFYNRTYAGFRSGRPGGASFNAHPPAQFAANHGGALSRGSTVNGNAFRGSNTSRNTQSFANRGANGYRGNYSAPRNNYSAPRNNDSAPRSNYSAPRSNYSAPRSNYSAPHSNYSAPHASYSGGGGGGHFGGGGSPSSGRR